MALVVASVSPRPSGTPAAATRIVGVQLAGRVLQQTPGGPDGATHIGARRHRRHPRPLDMGQILSTLRHLWASHPCTRAARPNVWFTPVCSASAPSRIMSRLASVRRPRPWRFVSNP